jgi:ATP/maltotriose-dependent transcriptional regulator MalT
MTWRYSAHCYASLGQLALLKGDPERARRLADQCLETAEPTHSRTYESWAWRIKGESATARHAWGEAEDALGRARALAEAIGQPRKWMSQVATGDCTRHRACGGATRHYRAAWTIIAVCAPHPNATFEPGSVPAPDPRVENLARPNSRSATKGPSAR